MPLEYLNHLHVIIVLLIILLLLYETIIKLKKKKNNTMSDFPGGPLAETLSSQCRGSRFHPWSRN